MPDVVPQLGIVAVYAEAGDENCWLILPVKVPEERLEGVDGEEEDENEAQKLLAKNFLLHNSWISECHEEGESHGGDVQDPLGDNKPDGEEQIGGRKKGNSDDRDAEQYDVTPATQETDEGDVEEPEDENDGGQVPGIGEGRDQRYRAHGPVAAEVAWRQ